MFCLTSIWNFKFLRGYFDRSLCRGDGNAESERVDAWGRPRGGSTMSRRKEALKNSVERLLDCSRHLCNYSELQQLQGIHDIYNRCTLMLTSTSQLLTELQSLTPTSSSMTSSPTKRKALKGNVTWFAANVGGLISSLLLTHLSKRERINRA